jgi:hypothetical protein
MIMKNGRPLVTEGQQTILTIYFDYTIGREAAILALPETEEELGYDDLVDRILTIESIFENTVGKEICDYCFPEPITTLSQFSI